MIHLSRDGINQHEKNSENPENTSAKHEYEYYI